MSGVVGQGGVTRAAERGLFDWSITKILFATSALAIVHAALIQYIVLFTLSSQFQRLFENETSAKVVAQLDGFRLRASRGMMGGNPQALKSVADEILRMDSSYQMVLFYDSRGRNTSYYQRDDISVELVKALTRSVGLHSLRPESLSKKSFEVGIVRSLDQRTMDAMLTLDNKSEVYAANSDRTGFVRLLVSLDKVDGKLAQLRWFSAIAVIVTTAISTLLFLLTIHKTVSGPIERAVLLMASAVENEDSIPRLQIRSTDALQVKQLMRALHEGLSEISIRHRTTSLIDLTRRVVDSSPKEVMFEKLANLWVGASLATECKVLLLRRSKDTGQYYVEKILESTKYEVRRHHGTNRVERKQTQIVDVQRDMMTETVLRFVETDREIDWANSWLVARAPMQVLNEESLLVLAIVPNETSGVPPDRFEEISLRWLIEVARLHQELRYKSLAGDIEIARELHRKWLKFSAKQSGEGVACEGVFSCESYSGVQGLGDFVFASNTESDNVSVTVLGTVGGRDLRSGLAATSVVAALADRFQGLKSSDPQKILRGVSASINDYLWSVYRGKLTAACSIIVFDHECGIGHFSSFGMHFPFLLTPMERKPMVIAQIEQCGVLGGSDNYNFVLTPFDVVPGQIIFAGTQGLLELENVHKERFSKNVLSGGLAEIVDNHYNEPAKALLQRVMGTARTFGGVKSNVDDMTAVLLVRKFDSIGG